MILWYNIYSLMRDTVDCPTEAASHGTCGVATGLGSKRVQENSQCRFIGEAVYCAQHVQRMGLHRRCATLPS